MHLAPIIGWTHGETPTVPAGLTVTAIATGLEHPRSIYALPNCDVVGATAGAFAHTAGWLSPHRLTPSRIVAGFGAPAPADLGHRHRHAKGVCFTGRFEAMATGPGTAG